MGEQKNLQIYIIEYDLVIKKDYLLIIIIIWLNFIVIMVRERCEYKKVQGCEFLFMYFLKEKIIVIEIILLVFRGYQKGETNIIKLSQKIILGMVKLYKFLCVKIYSFINF